MNSTPERSHSLDQSNETIPAHIITEGERKALEIISKLNLPYHNEKHIKRVVENFLQIVQVMVASGTKVSPKTIQIGILAASFHDSVQNFSEDKSAGGKIMRKRMTRENEKSSMLPLFDYMDEVSAKIPGTFTEEHKELVRKMIEVTIPDFDINQGGVFQPNLSKDSSPVEIALALADIGTAGIGMPEDFIMEGNSLFCEENIDISEAVLGLKSGLQIDDEHQKLFKERMIAWSKTQPNFVDGREKRFELDTAGLTEQARYNLKKKLFKYFGESKTLASQKVAERERMSFSDLLDDMGYFL